MDRFQRTIDLPKRIFFGKKADDQDQNGFTSVQLAGIKNLANRKLIEGALDELERARPFLDARYYQTRVLTLEKGLAALKVSKKETKQVVEIHLVG
jgi:hypothetical protein